jgi:DNA-directed RNA polymerase specialized sigma24 family protein
MVLAMTEAGTKIDESRTEQEAKAFQWSYAVGRAKHFFTARTEIATAENIRLDYHHGDDGDDEEKGSLTMADMIADKSLPEGYSVEVMEAINSLSPEDRTVILCRYVEKLSAEETLARLGIECRTDCSTFRMEVSRRENAALESLRGLLMVAAA